MTTGTHRLRHLGRFTLALASTLAGGCYHYTFQQRPTVGISGGGPSSTRLVTFTERRPTYLNGFIGNGKVDVTRYCRRPVRTELRVTAADVLISMGTLLVYTPHTLSVTCEVPATGG